MKKILSVLIIFLALNQVNAADTSAYFFSVDLTKLNSDKLVVKLQTPSFREDKVVYRFPAMVPGTYSVYNFGRFVENFKAFDSNGKELVAERLDTNSWSVKGAAKLHSITYEVNDTWDATKDNFIFEPAGTNFEEGKNFVINNHGLFGYFDNYKKLPFNITFTKPQDFVGSTALIPVEYNGSRETYRVADYMELTDSPIMFCKPDTTLLSIGGAQILVSLYDEGNKVNSSEIATDIKEIMIAANEYLGGSLPIKKYAFLIYLFEGESGSGASGALEHSYSSVYSLPSLSGKEIGPVMRDVAAHEFYHIITPLNIHSEEIGDFDYANPEMSKHLWLYEGVTEYTAGYVQLRQGLMSLDEYMDVIKMKVYYSQNAFNDTLAFTELSEKALGEHKDQYQNVYLKGALIGLCLDIRLRELSDGAMGIQNLIDNLSKEFGKEKSFNDDELFQKIVSMTYPEIAEFFKKYVEGNEPLPLKETFNSIGYVFENSRKMKDFSLGGASLGADPKSGDLFVYSIQNLNSVGLDIGYMEGDRIVSLNKTRINANNFAEVLGSWKQNVKEGDRIKLKVERIINGKTKKRKLTGSAVQLDMTSPLTIKPAENPTGKQIKILNSWLGK